MSLQSTGYAHFTALSCEPAQTANVCSGVCASTQANGSHLSQAQVHTHALTSTRSMRIVQAVSGGQPVTCHGREVKAHSSIQTFLNSKQDLLSWPGVNGL